MVVEIFDAAIAIAVVGWFFWKVFGMRSLTTDELADLRELTQKSPAARAKVRSWLAAKRTLRLRHLAMAAWAARRDRERMKSERDQVKRTRELAELAELASEQSNDNVRSLFRGHQ